MSSADLERAQEDLAARPTRPGGATKTCDPGPTTITVMVFCALDKTPLGGATVKLTGAADAQAETDDGTGAVAFDPASSGDYQLEVVLSEAQLRRYRAPEARSMQVHKGEAKTVLVEIQRFTPYQRAKLTEGPAVSARATIEPSPRPGAQANHTLKPLPGGQGDLEEA